MPRHTILPAVLTVLSCLPCSSLVEDPPTWTEIDGIVYGAKPDERGPIGGGEGYASIVTKGDFTANDLDSLLDALSKAKAGQVVFIPGETEIDLTARIYIEQTGAGGAGRGDVGGRAGAWRVEGGRFDQ